MTVDLFALPFFLLIILSCCFTCIFLSWLVCLLLFLHFNVRKSILSLNISSTCWCLFLFLAVIALFHLSWNWLPNRFVVGWILIFMFLCFLSANLPVTLLADLDPLDWGWFFLIVVLQVVSLFDYGNHHSRFRFFDLCLDEILLQLESYFCPALENLCGHPIPVLP